RQGSEGQGRRQGERGQPRAHPRCSASGKIRGRTVARAPTHGTSAPGRGSRPAPPPTPTPTPPPQAQAAPAQSKAAAEPAARPAPAVDAASFTAAHASPSVCKLAPVLGGDPPTGHG